MRDLFNICLKTCGTTIRYIGKTIVKNVAQDPRSLKRKTTHEDLIGDPKVHPPPPPTKRALKNVFFLGGTLPETNIAYEHPIFPGKYHQNGGFSMAMLVYRSVR